MEKIELLENVAEWLNKEDDKIKLSKLSDLATSGKYFVTVWGHYSAGKSKLINNIVDRDILPVKSKETTAVLTYIYYGENEECRIIYDDSSFEKCGIESIKDIFQDSDRFPRTSEIDHIEVYLDNYLLANGLVIVDTPGVNTLIQKHMNLAIDAINQSNKIVYVLGGAPSNVDKTFIKQITKCGIRPSFVRTKCDQFNTDEENPEESLKDEMKAIHEITEESVEFIPVSNEKDSEWNGNIEAVRRLLRNIAASVEKEIDNTIQDRINVFAEEYAEEVTASCENIESVLEGDTAKIESEIAECNEELKSLQDSLDDFDRRVEDKTEKAKDCVKSEINVAKERSAEKFSKTIAGISDSHEEIEKAYTKCFEDFVEKTQKIINDNFDVVLEDEYNSLNDLVSSIDIGIAPTYSEVQEENTRNLEIYRNRLSEAKNQLALISEQKESLAAEGIEFDEEEYDAIMSDLNQQLSQIPTEVTMKLVEYQGVQPSAVMKKIGQTIDIGFLLIPGDMIAEGIKGVANTAKIAKTIKNAADAGGVASKAISAGKKILESADSIDKARDIAYALNNITKKSRFDHREKYYDKQGRIIADTVGDLAGKGYDKFREDKKSGNVLDALSVAYWTEKVGAKFDHPPIYEVDREAEEEKTKMRNEITQQQMALSKKRIEAKKQMGLLGSKQRELEETEKENRLAVERAEEEISREEDIAVKKAKQNAMEKYRAQYAVFFSDNAEELIREITTDYFDSLSQNIVLYISSQNAELKKAINEKKNNLEALIATGEESRKELAEKLEEGKQFIAQLKVACLV